MQDHATSDFKAWELSPERLELAADEVHVWRANLEHEESVLRRLEETLSSDEQVRANRFFFSTGPESFSGYSGHPAGATGEIPKPDRSASGIRLRAAGQTDSARRTIPTINSVQCLPFRRLGIAWLRGGTSFGRRRGARPTIRGRENRRALLFCARGYRITANACGFAG